MAVPLEIIHAIFDEENRPRQAIPRPIRTDGFNLPEDEFRRMFRLPRRLAHQLCEQLRCKLAPRTNRSNALSVETKVLCALRFYATGSYQNAVGSCHSLSVCQGSVSNCIRAVTSAIIEVLLDVWIKFPSAIDALTEIKQSFYDAYGFPGVVGLIDCTHVNIAAPEGDVEYRYVNRKNQHSINVQLVCDYNLRILNVNPKFPGSAHDAFIWRSSSLRDAFEDGRLGHPGTTWLLGDSGYPLEPWLLIPYTSPSHGSSQARYNQVHSAARSRIERCNGVLKSRFRCLNRQRVLYYCPVVAAEITLACCVLHNMCVHEQVHIDAVDEVGDMFDTVDLRGAGGSNDGNTIRNRIVQRYFSN